MLKKGLGRGLQALLPEVEVTDGQGVIEVEIGLIRPNPSQPRKRFDQEKLDELAASIREHGVVQPLILRPRGEGYDLVAGERRWRAARLAGLKTVPALVRDFTEAQVMEIALIENLQREDLNPMEEAQAFRRLTEEFGLNQEELAKRLGKSRPQITNTLRLLNLSPSVQDLVAAGQVSMGHAKVLLSVEDPAVQIDTARRIVSHGLSVRETENLTKQMGQARNKKGAGRKSARNPVLVDLEGELRHLFGTPIRIVEGSPKGRIEINYYGEADLERIVDLLMGREGREALEIG